MGDTEKKKRVGGVWFSFAFCLSLYSLRPVQNVSLQLTYKYPSTRFYDNQPSIFQASHAFLLKNSFRFPVVWAKEECVVLQLAIIFQKAVCMCTYVHAYVYVFPHKQGQG